jgi:hypothetical protein
MASPASGQVQDSIDRVAATLATTVNVSALDDSPDEASWGCCELQGDWFDAVADAGFTAVRLAVRFSGHQNRQAPYTIDAAFMSRVQWAVDQITARGLTVVIDNPHWGGPDQEELIFDDPASQTPRLMAIWKQVGERFAGYDDAVVFEILNEPHGHLEATWNDVHKSALALIRKSNPTRAVVVTPAQWGDVAGFKDLDLPDDPNLIVSFHLHDPMTFTHQGADWVTPIPPLGVAWPSPNAVRAPGWTDWSWGSDVDWGADGASVTFTDPWGAFAFHAEQPVEGVTAISITADSALDVLVQCTVGEGEAPQPAKVSLEAGVATVIEATLCGATAAATAGAVGTAQVQNVWIQADGSPLDPQSASSDAPAPGAPAPDATFSAVTVVTQDGDLPLMTDDVNALHVVLDAAAAYGDAHHVPMFLGEFGVIEKADLDSRVRWTREVRTYARGLGIPTAYWALNNLLGAQQRLWPERPNPGRVDSGTAGSGDRPVATEHAL